MAGSSVGQSRTFDGMSFYTCDAFNMPPARPAHAGAQSAIFEIAIAIGTLER